MTIDRQPCLSGELVELRPLREGDFPYLRDIAADPLVWEQHPSKDRTDEAVYRQVFDETIVSGGALAIVDRRGGEVIGTSRFDHHVPELDQVEIGWTMLARSHWGGTYNGEVKRLMVAHASRFVRYVVFRVHSRNFRSQRAVEKLGATRVGSAGDPFGRGDNVIYRLDVERYLLDH